MVPRKEDQFCPPSVVRQTPASVPSQRVFSLEGDTAEAGDGDIHLVGAVQVTAHVGPVLSLVRGDEDLPRVPVAAVRHVQGVGVVAAEADEGAALVHQGGDDAGDPAVGHVGARAVLHRPLRVVEEVDPPGARAHPHEGPVLGRDRDGRHRAVEGRGVDPPLPVVAAVRRPVEPARAARVDDLRLDGVDGEDHDEGQGVVVPDAAAEKGLPALGGLVAAVVVARQGVLPAEVDVLRLEGVEAAHGPVALVPVPGVPELAVPEGVGVVLHGAQDLVRVRRVGPEIEELEGGQVLVEGLPVVVVETVPPVARDRTPPQPAVAGHVEAVVRGVEEGAVEVRVNGLGARCPVHL